MLKTDPLAYGIAPPKHHVAAGWPSRHFAPLADGFGAIACPSIASASNCNYTSTYSGPPLETHTATTIATTVIDEPTTVLTAAAVPIIPSPKWYNLAYWFGPTPWDLGFELGINGAEGINQALSLRTGGHLKRETEFWKFDTTLVYNKNTANDVETQNNSLLDVRIDRKLGESPWSLFFMNQELYDEFQAYDPTCVAQLWCRLSIYRH